MCAVDFSKSEWNQASSGTVLKNNKNLNSMNFDWLFLK